MTENIPYYTGIRRDETNKTIWRRSSDGVQVKLEGWRSNRFPASNDDWNILYWDFWSNSKKNTIFNLSDYSTYFYCEY